MNYIDGDEDGERGTSEGVGQGANEHTPRDEDVGIQPPLLTSPAGHAEWN